jgi:hypothetical protein
MSKQGTAGNRKHTTFMSPLKLETIRRSESGKIQRVVMASYTIGSSTIYNTKKSEADYDHLWHQVKV